MKLIIDGYEVEIKAKAVYSNRTNKADTQNFLNKLSVWALEASKYNAAIGAYATARDDVKASDEIYEVLKAQGVYDNL